MCGFAGILNNGFPIGQRQIAAIAGSVSFRGPDSCGIRFYNEHLQAADRGIHAMFFNRLAIIDLDKRSDQPFEDERYTLLFNGEIYNYQELKKNLQKEDVVFHTTSDTEVLFHMLIKLGVKGLSLLNGMFAFCWIDRKERKYIVARDRTGIKPLYYKYQGTSFIFGSELDSVLRLSDGQSLIRPESVQQFLWMQFIPSPNSIIKNIQKLPPGHYIEGDLNSLNQGQNPSPIAYWDAYAEVGHHPVNANPKLLENVLVDSLRRQMVADVPLGLFLSSGVDSSLLAALVNKHFGSDKPINFFTVAFDETTVSDESGDALSFINGFNNPRLQSHLLTIDAALIGEKLDRLYDYFDEPFGDHASLLNWVISAKARESATVVISGDGADELFWGYDRYDRWQHPSFKLTDRFNIPDKISAVAGSLMPGKYWRAKRSLELEPDGLKRHFALFLPPALQHLMQHPIWNDPVWALEHVSAILGRKDMTAILDIKTYLADAMLYKVDRASMAASLEVRVPYLDNTVIDLALRLSFEEKSNQAFRHKAILKNLLQELAPHYSIHRPKKGFNFPLDKWLRTTWKDRVRSSVTRESVASLGLDDKIYLSMVDKYYAGDRKFTIVVWYLLNLVLWNQKFSKISALRPV